MESVLEKRGPVLIFLSQNITEPNGDPRDPRESIYRVRGLLQLLSEDGFDRMAKAMETMLNKAMWLERPEAQHFRYRG